MQRPGIVTEDGTLLLEMIEYDEKGRVILSGHGVKDTAIRAYLDNDYIGESPVDEDNRKWNLISDEEVKPGDYILRVDQVDDAGTVLSRISVPFRGAPKEEIQMVRNNPGRIIIQPGDNLWTIARQIYKRGILYTVIYLDNKDKIRDPDLIYPGQVFSTPDL